MKSALVSAHAGFSRAKKGTYDATDEFRDMVKALHRAGIKAILDVVFNAYWKPARYRTEVAIMDKQTEYVERLSAQMVEWDNQIDQLKDKAERATPESKHEYCSAIAALRLKRDEAAVKLQGISVASDDEWEDLKNGTEHVWGEVRTILHDTIMKIK